MIQNSQSKIDRRRALITGGAGLLGRFMTEQLKASGWEVFAFSHAALDVSDSESVRAAFIESQPNLVINCAATTDVDRCERDPAWAYVVNENGPRLLAQQCNLFEADLVHISTDYVFDGLKGTFYSQEDEPNPLSVYAKAKLAGEIAVQNETARLFVVRTSWIFGPGGKNFGSKIVEMAQQGAHIKAVIDQISIPTYAPDLSARIEEVINLGEYGLYHLTNSSPASWFDFAGLALSLSGFGDIEIEPVTRKELGQAAPRPQDTPMRCLISEKLGLSPLRDWRDALGEFVSKQGYKSERI